MLTMTLTDETQKPSVIEFEDKHNMRSTFSGEEEPDGERIECKIPELDLGERIVLNAWGSWEVHHYNDHRRRLGVYSVISKEGEDIRYVLKEEERFSEYEMVHKILSGDFEDIGKLIEGLRYIALDMNGRLVS